MRSFVVSLCAAMALVGLVWVISAADDGNNEVVNRGRYLVEFAGCSECHTPLKMGPNGPEEDTERLFSGHPQDAILPPPWGISYGSNLTSDPDTGLGAWDRDQFVAALKTGQHLGMGRDILPPMPHYRTVTDEDLEAMFAYFMTVPPIKNEVPDPVPPASGAP